MKKFIFSFALGLVFLGAGAVHADVAPVSVTCDFPDHAIWNGLNDAKVGCITDIDWKLALSNQLNQSDAGSESLFVSVPRGQKLLTTFGLEDVCPSWYPPSGCQIKKSLFVKWL